MAIRGLALGALIVAGAAFAPSPGPAERRCEIERGEDLKIFDRGTPFERTVLRGGVRIVCTGGVSIDADSAESHSVTGERRFIGRVFYRDSLKTLEADRVDYFDHDGRILARGEEVVLTDIEKGSVVRGTELEYFREMEHRPEARAIVRGRPHAILYDGPAPATATLDAPADAAGGGADAEDRPPLEIDADWMEMLGERVFRAIGQVEIQRGEMRGWADEAEFDQLEDRMLLTGNARVEEESYALAGEEIEAWREEEALHEVIASGDAILTSKEMRMDAPKIRILFHEGELDRLIAFGPRTATETADTADAASPETVRATASDPDLPGIGPARPRVIAEEFWLIADSIDALTTGQRLTEVIAVGDAYGERAADSTDVGLAPLIARDWLRGDTITGYFVQEPAPVAKSVPGTDEPAPGEPLPGTPAEAEAPDSAETEMRTVLERLVAVGADGRARSLYRLREDGREQDAPSVNYLVANRIVLHLKDGEVSEVEADGPIHGLHLEPARPSRSDETPPEPGR